MDISLYSHWFYVQLLYENILKRDAFWGFQEESFWLFNFFLIASLYLLKKKPREKTYSSNIFQGWINHAPLVLTKRYFVSIIVCNLGLQIGFALVFKRGIFLFVNISSGYPKVCTVSLRRYANIFTLRNGRNRRIYMDLTSFCLLV